MDIQVRDNWDGTQTLLLDGEVVLERKPKAEIEQKANVLRLAIMFKSLDRIVPDRV
jgi:hypothetical protein